MKPICVAIVFLLSTTISAFCADFYVSTAGSDSNPGTQAQPFATIQHAIGVCPQLPDSTVHLDASTWNESPIISVKSITLKGDYNGPNGMGGRTTSIVNGTISIGQSSFTTSNSVRQLTTRSIGFGITTSAQTIDSCDITYGTGAGITISFAPYGGNAQITNCLIAYCTGAGISCGPNGTDFIGDNIIHDCGGDGINSSCLSNIASNTIYDCNSWGLTGGFDSIYENQIYGNSSGGIKADECDSGIYQNAIENNHSYGLQIGNYGYPPKVYNNSIQNNESYGVYLTGANCNPDLGGGAQSSVGNNTISGNGTYEVYNASPNNIYAKNNNWDSQSEGEMSGGYYNTVNVTRIWDKWEDASKGYIVWSDPNPTRTAAPSLGMLKAIFYPSSNTVGKARKR